MIPHTHFSLWQQVALGLSLWVALAYTSLTTVYAVTLVVTTTADEANQDGDCSLREAIQAANKGRGADRCPAGNGADTIQLAAGLYTLALPRNTQDARTTHSVSSDAESWAATVRRTGELTSSLFLPVVRTLPDVWLASNNASGDLDLFGAITIQGAKNGETILDGAQLDRVLHIHTEATVELDRLTIRNGKAPDGASSGCGVGGNDTCPGEDGGGIANSGTMVIQQSTIYGNRTSDGGHCGFGRCALDGGSGGGIANQGTLTLVNSTIDANSTGSGTTSFSGSSAGGDGGGIYNAGVLWLTHSTLSSNVTGQDGSIGEDIVTGGDGGGIANEGGAVQMKNTIVADNLSVDALSECSGVITAQGYNLVKTLEGCTVGGNTTGNITGRRAWLMPLADNGGPTWTRALDDDSPAVDKGTCTDLDGQPVTVDQRGVARPQDDACDIGAYEGAE
jgi:CSLREA domain-containing protein